MTALDHRDVLMYVRSEETIRLVLPPDAQNEVIQGMRSQGYHTVTFSSGLGSGRVMGTSFNSGYYGNKPVREKELSEAEVEAIGVAWTAIREKGKTLHIVDVGRESALRRVIEEHLHHLEHFPVLVRPDGRRLEGVQNFTLRNLETFLSDSSQDTPGATRG
ncbi:MAG: hypothetical protein WBF81_02970 [Thermoplasmata archaeon]